MSRAPGSARRLSARLRRRAQAEHGVVLVIVALTLTAILAFAAIAINIGSFYTAQRKAQAAADAGALAAADDLAQNNSGQMVSDGQSYAEQTDRALQSSGISVAAYGSSGTEVQVTVQTSTPDYFGKLFGLPSQAHVKESAVAGETTTKASCSGQNCYVIFAMDQNCKDNGVAFSGGGYNITGGIHSNGSINTGGGGSKFGPTTYGNGTGCSGTNGGGGNTFYSGPTAEAPITTWPVNYAAAGYFPACPSTGVTCTGPNGTPSYCTYASSSGWLFGENDSKGNPILPSNAVYCAYGTGNPANPATYTGSISFNWGGHGTSSSPELGTYIAGTITTTSGGWWLQAYNYPTNKLLGYAAESGSAISLGGGSNSFNGDWFAPAGSISMTAGSQNVTFLEGQDVSLLSGGLTGDGPPDNQSGTTTSFTTALLQ